MKVGTTRIEAFSDGVIVIVITIMILELKLPDINRQSTTKDILEQLHHMVPYFISYIFSYTMIGILWTNHHHMFHFLEKADEHLLWQNFIFLFLMSLIPLATYIVGSTPFIPISPNIYALVMLLTTSSLFTMQHYSLRKRLIHKDTDKELTREIKSVSSKAKNKAAIATLIYFISIPLAYVNVYLAYACFILPPIIFFVPQGLDNEKLAEKVIEKNV